MEKQKRALKDVRYAITRSDEVPPEVKDQVTATVDSALEGSPLENDKWIYRIVVMVLGVAILGCLAATYFIFSENVGKQFDMPEIFLAVGSAAVGALAGLLAPSPGRSAEA